MNKEKLFWISPYFAMIIGLYFLNSAWIAFLLYHLFIGIYIYTEKTNLQLLLKGWNNLFGIGSIIFGLSGGLIIYLLAPYAGINSEMLNPILSSLGLNGFLWLLFVFYHFLVNPWFEEIFWRNKINYENKKIILSDLFFAGYHLLVLNLFLAYYWLILAFFILVIASWFWRYLAVKYKGLLLPTISHMAADASIMLVVYFLAG